MSGYEIARVDELDVMPVNDGEFTWRPVRRRFGISAFGTNGYSAEKPPLPNPDGTKPKKSHSAKQATVQSGQGPIFV